MRVVRESSLSCCSHSRTTFATHPSPSSQTCTTRSTPSTRPACLFSRSPNVKYSELRIAKICSKKSSRSRQVQVLDPAPNPDLGPAAGRQRTRTDERLPHRAPLARASSAAAAAAAAAAFTNTAARGYPTGLDRSRQSRQPSLQDMPRRPSAAPSPSRAWLRPCRPLQWGLRRAVRARGLSCPSRRRRASRARRPLTALTTTTTTTTTTTNEAMAAEVVVAVCSGDRLRGPDRAGSRAVLRSRSVRLLRLCSREISDRAVDQKIRICSRRGWCTTVSACPSRSRCRPARPRLAT